MVSVSCVISAATSSSAAVAPALCRPRGMRDHRLRVADDALPVKGRLHEPPLPQMRLSFRRQQPFAEEPLRALERRVLS